MSDNAPIAYIERSKAYYEAQGFDKPYQWFESEDIPFAKLTKPLADCTVTIVTTAMPDESYIDEHRRLHIGKMNTPPEKFFTGGLFWDRDATHTNARETSFPLKQLQNRIDAGDLGRLAEHFYCVPTIYSHRRTLNRDAPKIVEQCLTDEVDVALLVPL